MNTAAPVTLVDPYSSGAGLARALARAGYRVVAVLSEPLPAPVLRKTFRGGDFETVLGPVRDAGEVLADVAALHPIAVLPGSECGVEVADVLASRLTPEWSNVPELSTARRHKGTMQRAVAASGLPVLRTSTASDAGAARGWIDEHGLTGRDVVVKPALSAGTEDVTLLPAGAGLEQAFHRLIGRTNLLGVSNTDLVVQERAVGVEFVVDTFSDTNGHWLTSICRYHRTQTPEGFGRYESLEFVAYEPAEHGPLVGYVRKVLDALGIRFGYAHTEVMLTADGPRLLEVGARLGGAGLPAAAALATGREPASRLIAHLRHEPGAAGDFVLERPVLIAYFIASRSGTISNVAAYRSISKLASCRYVNVNVNDGDHVNATTDLMSTMGLGWAVFAHRDRSRLLEDRQAMRALEAAVRIDDIPVRVGS